MDGNGRIRRGRPAGPHGCGERGGEGTGRRGSARTLRGIRLAAVLLTVVRPGAAAEAQTLLDAFDTLAGWTAAASDGATVTLALDAGREGQAMRIDFDLPKDGGWVIVHKDVDLPLPENYAFTFQLRGEAPQQNFEFKLVDPSRKNVWWNVHRDFTFPSDWRLMTVRKARIALAWGSRTPLKKVGAIELAISTGNGGKGSVWIDDLAFEEREPASQYRRTAKVSASSAVADHEPEKALDADVRTSWRSAPAADPQWLQIDFVRERDYGGLQIDWDAADFALEYRVDVSDDGEKWTTAFVNLHGKGGREFAYMPDAESRYIRLVFERSSRGQGYGVVGVAIEPVEFSESPNEFFRALAAESPPGAYPKYFSGRQTYWTVVGVAGDRKNALLNEEGMLEVEKGSFSIEPFLNVGGELVSWSTVHARQSLDDGYLPIPSVEWQGAPVSLRVTAFAAGEAGASTLYALYTVENRSGVHQRASLFLAIRPFQVNPPWQSLNMTGGVAPIHEIRFDAETAWINRDRPVVSLSIPDRFGATSIERGALLDFLREGTVPPRSGVSDRFGFASGALQYTVDLDPGAARQFALEIPLHSRNVFTPPAADAMKEVGERLDEARRRWRTLLGHVDLELPLDGDRIARAVKTTLAYVLINQSGPKLQPGSRNYARSWIRDGVLTGGALLEMGFTEEPRRFLDWFSGYQLPDGRVPCCVDRRGADPVVENDSDGEFIYGIADVYRFTRDIGFVAEMWPRIVKAVDHLDSLRRQRTTDAFRLPGKDVFFGLLPPSISHEGYASHPEHSYWDDFFALRGFKDAAALAVAMGDEDRAARYAGLRDAFRSDLVASIARSMEQHRVDYVPGAADLGDFDPSSTAVVFDPVGEEASLPRAALQRTFERYLEVFRKRESGAEEWDAFAPYELRNVSALVRLGRRRDALEVLGYMLAHQRPTEWSEWPEIVWRDAAAPAFIGDMPHTWIGSTFVRAVRSFFVYEREADRSLVLAAGVPREWVTGGRRTVVKRLPTHFGVLGYSLESDSPERLRLRLSGDLRVPPGSLVVRPPLAGALRAVRVNGRPIASFTADEATVSEFPAEVELESAPLDATAAPNATSTAAPTAKSAASTPPPGVPTP